MSNSDKAHWMVVKWILIYLKGTSNTGLMIKKTICDVSIVNGYIDSDFVGDKDIIRLL